MKTVYVVYKLGEEGMEDLRVFSNHADAKWFKEHRLDGQWTIWQQPVNENYDYCTDRANNKAF